MDYLCPLSRDTQQKFYVRRFHFTGNNVVTTTTISVDGAMQVIFLGTTDMVKIVWGDNSIIIPVELLFHLCTDPDIRAELGRKGYQW